MAGNLRRRAASLRLAAATLGLWATLGGGAAATTVGNFSVGQLRADTPGSTGCAANGAAEPAIHVSRADDVFVGSESGLLGGSQLWRGLGTLGGPTASACALEYRGQPNVLLPGIGLAGGDIDIALASAPNAAGHYNVYVASLYLASVNVAHSADDGLTFAQTPVLFGIPLDDREWIAAYGADTSLLTYHDLLTNDIDVLRSDDGGGTYTQIAQAIPLTDYRARTNQIGNLVIDHRNPPPGGAFYAYQAFVAPSAPGGAVNNEAFVAVTPDGGHSWSDQAIPCSTSSRGLDHNFPNVSVDPAGHVWSAWSDDQNVYAAESGDHGQTWTCSAPISGNTTQAIFPWLAATAHGVDLVYYASPTAPGTAQTFYVYFAQNLYTTAGAPVGWRKPQRLVAVHTGAVCEGGIVCTTGRQLFDDFGVDTDTHGYAHIAYSHDNPDLGGGSAYTGYAVQEHGLRVGRPNN